jgi:predicted TIM-barrel fold metal-dependent hydrolase
MSKWAPDSREADSWFSDEQLTKVTPADAADDGLNSPIPTQMVSNGEYMPEPQTPQQKRVESGLKQLADEASKALGVNRRDFMRSSGGVAASFLTMNKVFGEFFTVSKDEVYEPEAYAANSTPRSLFVMDDQLHIIRSSQGGPGSSLRDLARGVHTSNNPFDHPDELGGVNTPWNPAMVTDPKLRSSWHLPNFIKWVYLDSQVTVGLLTNNNSAALPDGSGGTRPPKNVFESEAAEGLTAEQTMAARDFINRVSGSKRAMGHGQLYVGKGNLDYMRYQIEELKPDVWKGYTIAAAAKVDDDPKSDMRRWRLDDEEVAYPTYELIDSYASKEKMKQYPGFRTLCIHKGLSTLAGRVPELGHPLDITKAARDYPHFNFAIYHSAIRPGFWVENALADINGGRLRNGAGEFDVGTNLHGGVPDILWSTEFAYIARNLPNVYAELGTTFASCVITFPTVCAHLLGQFLKIMGEDRILFGSDSVHYGSPQWQIDALWRFQIPEAMRRRWGYPELTKAVKRKILGLNAARLYKLPVSGEDFSGHGEHEGREEGEGREKGEGRGLYRPVPQNYQNLFDPQTKRILEFPANWTPCFVPGGTNTCPTNPFSMDRMSQMKEAYAQAGGKPDHVRRGWLRTRL